jgi:hypothetical protein
MVELLVILPVMLLLIFGTIQLALIYHAKITLNYAAYEAVRAGTLNGSGSDQDETESASSQYEAVKEGFARGLAPLYSYYEPDASARSHMHEPALSQVEAFQQGRAKVFEEFDSPLELIRIERLNPTKQAFIDFARDGLIPNDNLMYRSKMTGGASQVSIQDANLLHLRFTYWYPLYVPFINKLMFDTFICGRGLGGDAWSKWASDPACQSDVPRIPLTATAVMRMQSPIADSTGWYRPKSRLRR